MHLIYPYKTEGNNEWLTAVAHSPHYTSHKAFQQWKTQRDTSSFHIFHQEHQLTNYKGQINNSNIKEQANNFLQLHNKITEVINTLGIS